MQSSMIPAPPVIPIPAPPVVAPPMEVGSVTPPPIANGAGTASTQEMDATTESRRFAPWMGFGVGLIAGAILLSALMPLASSDTRRANNLEGAHSHPASFQVPSVGVKLEFAPLPIDPVSPTTDEPATEPADTKDHLDPSVQIELAEMESALMQELAAPSIITIDPESIADDVAASSPATVQSQAFDPASLAKDWFQPESIGALDRPETLPTPPQSEPQSELQCDSGTCPSKLASHGTALEWADSLDEARLLAQSQKKLVFLIHISGNFEIPGFT